MNKINAINDLVIIIPDEKKEKTENGIIIPDMVEITAIYGEIYSAGDKCTILKSGDRVLYNSNECGKVEFNNKHIHITKEENIYAIIE